MAYTIDQYTKLQVAIATGATSVYYGDKRVDYRSLSDMKDLLQEMETQLGLKKKKSRNMKASFTKGV